MRPQPDRREGRGSSVGRRRAPGAIVDLTGGKYVTQFKGRLKKKCTAAARTENPAAAQAIGGKKGEKIEDLE
ncbi:MAG TPA: hypothetical protein VG889_18625 [Rhizomicrobium sp.]|nr:hypothetical protein [Rhizomicrobium sp.]